MQTCIEASGIIVDDGHIQKTGIRNLNVKTSGTSISRQNDATAFLYVDRNGRDVGNDDEHVFACVALDGGLFRR